MYPSNCVKSRLALSSRHQALCVYMQIIYYCTRAMTSEWALHMCRRDGANHDYVYTGVFSATVSGTAGEIVLLLVVLLCGFGTGVVTVYVLRQRKRNKQSKLDCSYYKHYSLYFINIPLYSSQKKF